MRDRYVVETRAYVSLPNGQRRCMFIEKVDSRVANAETEIPGITDDE